MKRWLSFLMCMVLIVTACFISVGAATIKNIVDEYERKIAEVEQEYSNGSITRSEYDAEMNRVYIVRMQKEYGKKASLEYLEKQQEDNSETRKSVHVWLTNLFSAKEAQEEIKMYYANSQKKSFTEIEQLPQITLSEALPVSDIQRMLSYGEGKLEADYFKKYVAAWYLVGYADGVPFAVFKVSYTEDGTYQLGSIYPSPEQASTLDAIVVKSGCYVISSISESKVSYCIVDDEGIQTVQQINSKTGAVDVIVQDSKEAEVYFYATKLAFDKNLENQLKLIGSEQFGGATNSMLTYKDTWNRAYYELYIRPYFIPAVAVLALGAAVLIVIRKRKQNKA